MEGGDGSVEGDHDKDDKKEDDMDEISNIARSQKAAPSTSHWLSSVSSCSYQMTFVKNRFKCEFVLSSFEYCHYLSLIVLRKYQESSEIVLRKYWECTEKVLRKY